MDTQASLELDDKVRFLLSDEKCKVVERNNGSVTLRWPSGDRITYSLADCIWQHFALDTLGHWSESPINPLACDVPGCSYVAKNKRDSRRHYWREHVTGIVRPFSRVARLRRIMRGAEKLS